MTTILHMGNTVDKKQITSQLMFLLLEPEKENVFFPKTFVYSSQLLHPFGYLHANFFIFCMSLQRFF